jgi:hypothetical protein
MTPFRKLFFGFLIVFIDIRIDGFDLLVDLAGYLLVVVGLAELGIRNRNFARARVHATVLLALSALDLLIRTPSGVYSKILLFGNEGLTVAFFILLLVVNLMMIYLICKGIGEMAIAANAPSLADLAMSRWTVFLITYILSNVLVIAAASDADLGLLAPVSVIASLVAGILIAGLVLRADKVLYRGGG